MRRHFLLLILTLSMSLWAQNDTLKVLCIGNSFTYFSDSPGMLKKIAESQGQTLKITSATVGGYSLYRHLHDLNTIRVVEIPGYNHIFLQDQSQAHARYATDPQRCHFILDDTQELAGRLRIYSPQAHIYLENTWAFPGMKYGGFEDLDYFDRMLMKGAQLIAKKCQLQVSPIGQAFAIVRQERKDICLYDEDGKHQSAYGTYLKSCVNFLLIRNTPFIAPVYVGELDTKKCEYLQTVAERVVLNQ